MLNEILNLFIFNKIKILIKIFLMIMPKKNNGDWGLGPIPNPQLNNLKKEIK